MVSGMQKVKVTIQVEYELPQRYDIRTTNMVIRIQNGLKELELENSRILKKVELLPLETKINE